MGRGELGPQGPASASTLLSSPRRLQHQQLPAGPASQSEEYVPAAGRAQSGTQRGFRARAALSSFGPGWLSSFALPSPGGLVRKEGSGVHSARSCSQSPPRRAWLLPAPLPQPGLLQAFISCPASLTSFLKQLLSVPPLSLRSASQLFPGAAPPAPSCPPSGPRCWHWLPGPPVAWPFPGLFGALPESAITSTHFSFSLTQGGHCPLRKEGRTAFKLPRRKEVCLPRVVGTTLMLRADTTCHLQAEHTSRRPT